MYMDFTQEQSDFAKSVASFCKKESGTREQRDLLTDHGAITTTRRSTRRWRNWDGSG